MLWCFYPEKLTKKNIKTLPEVKMHFMHKDIVNVKNFLRAKCINWTSNYFTPKFEKISELEFIIINSSFIHLKTQEDAQRYISLYSLYGTLLSAEVQNRFVIIRDAFIRIVYDTLLLYVRKHKWK